jgi:NADPH:quinone reductase-like Zn-dependent oxidoreductase
MKAIVQDKYGSADVLQLRELERPEAGTHDVLVRVVAAGVDRGAWHRMTGMPYVMRVMGFGLRAPKAPVPGTNFAGRVEAVGSEVTRFGAGDEVYGTCGGAYAEYACARADKLARKPPSLSFEQAAVLPHAGFAALQALRDRGRLQPGQKVLIIGAAGAVGSVAVQLAKALGGQVTGVCSTTTVDMVRALGADDVIDYTRDDFTHSGPYDLILDTGGNNSLSRLRAALTHKGTLVIVGGEGGRVIGMGRQTRAQMLSPFVGQTLATFVAKENAQDLSTLTGFVESGNLTPVIDRTYGLSDVPDAIRYFETGQARGRVVVSV